MMETKAESDARLPTAREQPATCPVCGISWESTDLRRHLTRALPWWRCSDCGAEWNELPRADRRPQLEPGDTVDGLAVWAQLWHSMAGAIIVGHPPGHTCPYRVGHTLREHVMATDPAVDRMFRRLIAAGLHHPPEGQDG